MITYNDLVNADIGEVFPWQKKWLKDARKFFNDLIKNGQATKDPCKICGTHVNCYAHFPNPERALDTIWICYKCVEKLKSGVLKVSALIEIMTPEMLAIWEKRKEKGF